MTTINSGFRRWAAAAIVSCLSFCCAAALASTCTQPPPGLVGWWPGDGNALDLVGGHHGSLRGGATAGAPGRVGSAFSMDGTNGYVEISDSPALRPAELTVECWVNFANLDTPGTSIYLGQQYLVFKQNSRFGDFEGYVLSKDRTHADIILWEVTSAAGKLVRIDSVSVVTSNAWYHLAGVRGSNYIELYFNGVLEARAEVDFPQDYGPEPLYFGTSGQDYYDRKLHGSLDEVALYNRALSAQEIRALYESGSAGKCRRPPAGTYRGLFATETAPQKPAGSVALAVTSRGSFTGTLSFDDGTAKSIAGKFGPDGTAALAVTNAASSGSPYEVFLARGTYDGADQITGYVRNALATTPLFAERQFYDGIKRVHPKSGRYTLAFEGNHESAVEPGGATYAVVNVGKSGVVTATGYLGDGTPFSQSTVVTSKGQWPFYVRLYSGRGSILGWIDFDSEPSSDLEGHLRWARPAIPTARYYKGGFTLFPEVEGSRFIPPALNQPVIDLPDGVLALEGGNLADSLENRIQFAPGAAVQNLGPHRMGLAVSRLSGLFTGTILDSALTPHSFSGVLLQKQNRGRGLFRGLDRTGEAKIEAVDP